MFSCTERNALRAELQKSEPRDNNLFMQTTTEGVENCTKNDCLANSRRDPLIKINLLYSFVLTFLFKAAVTITSDG